MDMYREVTALLAYLREFHIVEAVDEFYLDGHDNPAPGKLLRDQIEKMERWLEEERRK